MTSAIHATADVSPDSVVGARTRIWHYAQVREGAVIGEDCTIARNVYIGVGSRIGHRVKLQNGCGVFGAVIEDEALLAPGVLLVEDPTPRATNEDGTLKSEKDWDAHPVRICGGATVGAQAVVLPGVTVGSCAMVAAGSVVSRDVPPYALIGGNPGRQVGWVCRCGNRLDDGLSCKRCGKQYEETRSGIAPT